MTAQTYSAMPPIELDRKLAAHPLRVVFVTVIAAKIVIAAFLLANVSLAPPLSGDHSYVALAAK